MFIGQRNFLEHIERNCGYDQNVSYLVKKNRKLKKKTVEVWPLY